MTLNEIVATVRNNISDGLSGLVGNYSYSIEQLAEEVVLMRAKLLVSRLMRGKVQLKYYYQTIDYVMLKPQDISGVDHMPSGKKSLGFIIPSILSSINDDSEIVMVYTLDRERRFKVYRTIAYRDHKYRIKTKRSPFVYLDTSPDGDGMISGYLMNTGRYESIRSLVVQGVFSNPMDVKGMTADVEFPCPLEMQNDIISAMTSQYVIYYRQLNVPPLPNTQTSSV